MRAEALVQGRPANPFLDICDTHPCGIWLGRRAGLERVRFGRTDFAVSRVGFGCAAIGGYDYGPTGDRESLAAIRRALELGVNFFDTSDVYGLGHSEEILAAGLGEDRNKVVVATKFGVKWDARGRTERDISPRYAAEAIEASLGRLKLERIPVYQVHWPDGKTPIGDTLAALKRFQEAGKIGCIGVCNFAPEQVREAQRASRIESLQLPYSLVEPERGEEVHSAVEEFDLAFLPYSPLGQGLLTGRYGPGSKFAGTDLRARSERFSPDGLEACEPLIARVKSVIAGVKRPAQIEDNVGAAGWTLTPVEREFLEGGARLGDRPRA
ncbi:MAG: general stress protein [Acidobacteria bacterium]|nr:MAG: general stress protein [Acidobacteriota bacterium]